MPRCGVIVVAVLAALVAAGCGGSGDGRAAYVKALNKAQDALAQRFTTLGSRLTATGTPAQDARTLAAYEGAVTTTVADLRAVDPPDGFEELHRRFVGQVAGYATALRAARADLRDRDGRAILAAQGRLRAAIAHTADDLNATIRAINAKIKG